MVEGLKLRCNIKHFPENFEPQGHTTTVSCPRYDPPSGGNTLHSACSPQLGTEPKFLSSLEELSKQSQSHPLMGTWRHPTPCYCTRACLPQSLHIYSIPKCNILWPCMVWHALLPEYELIWLMNCCQTPLFNLWCLVFSHLQNPMVGLNAPPMYDEDEDKMGK